jgi:hypothetical protein
MQLSGGTRKAACTPPVRVRIAQSDHGHMTADKQSDMVNYGLYLEQLYSIAMLCAKPHCAHVDSGLQSGPAA